MGLTYKEDGTDTRGTPASSLLRVEDPKHEKPSGFAETSPAGTKLKKTEGLRFMWDRVLDHIGDNNGGGQAPKP